MDDLDFYNEELEGIDTYFKAFDVQHDLDGRISFEELSEVCVQTGLMSDQSQLSELYQIFHK